MKRLLFVLTVMCLTLPILLTACGSTDGGDTKTATPTNTSTATTISTGTPTNSATATPANNAGPVKIGVIYPTSGQFAVCGIIYDPIVALVEEQVKNQGGILGGREVKIYKGDDRGVVTEAAAQAKKLITDNKVSALAFGGVSAASFDAVSDVAEEYKVPYVALSALSDLANKKYSADIVGWPQALVEHKPHLEYLKPKSIAFLGYEISDIHYMMDGKEGITGMREWVKAMGIDIVYEQFFPVETVDFSPYVTKIKYLKPDLLFFWANDVGQEISIRKQIVELGGYGNMKFFSACMSGSSPKVTKNSASWGTYTNAQWIPGSSEPGMKAFEDAYVQKYGKEPDAQVPIGYNCIWLTIKAIELAGTDNPEQVASALRSGNLQWDSSMGPLHIDSDGHGWVQYGMAQIQEGGTLLQVYP